MRQKHRARMGPDGGDGGKGGNLIFFGNAGLPDLFLLKKQGKAIAPAGAGGGKKNCSGKRGSDLRVGLPLGTRIETAHGQILADILDKNDELVLKGGMGGKGNARFAHSKNRSPRKTTQGKLGDRHNLLLRLFLPCNTLLLSRGSEARSAHTCVTGRTHPNEITNPLPGVLVDPVWGHETILLLPKMANGGGLGASFLHHGHRAERVVWVGTAPPPPLQEELEVRFSDKRLIHWGEGTWKKAEKWEADETWKHHATL